MKVFLAVTMLLVNFFKATIISGLITAKIILFQAGTIRSGLATLPYGELNENMANLLGVMMTLTPGTTLVEIDNKSRQLVLHLLDLDAREETLAAIQHDFGKHLKILSEVFS